MRKFLGWTIAAFIVVICLSAVSQLWFIQPIPVNAQPVNAQPLRVQDVWQQVYQRLPDIPLENQYVSRETGNVENENTLVRRIVQYHVFQKGRPITYRLDWKLTLADYLGINEFMDQDRYTGANTLTPNPLAGDQAAVKRLTRAQRDALVQTLVDVMKSTR
jgi:hypothetical protein